MSSYAISRLAGDDDTQRLQQLLERCSDFYLLHEGWPTPADAAAYELTCVPPGKEVSDVFVLGMADGAGSLVAMAQLLRDYPSPRDWWVGTLVVDPQLRGRGIGAELFRHTVAFIEEQGGRSIGLAVALWNERALKFWESAGFRDTGRRSEVTARSGHAGTVRILVRDL